MSQLVAQTDGGAVAGPPPAYFEAYPRSNNDIPTSEQFGLHDLARIFGRHRLLILLVITLITVATATWQLLSPPQYTSTATIQVQLIDDVGANQADILARNVQRITNEVKLYRSLSVVQHLVRDVHALNRPDFQVEMGNMTGKTDSDKMSAAISAVLRMSAVKADEGSDLIELSVTSRSPQLSAMLANAFPAAVRAMKNDLNAGRSDQLLATLNAEQARRAQLAADAAKNLVDFRQSRRMLVGAGSQEDLQQVNRIATEAASAAGMRAGSAARAGGVAVAESIQTTAGASSPVLEQLRRQDAEYSAEYARLSQTYGSGHPDVVRVQGQLSEVRDGIAREQAKAVAVASAVQGAEAARQTQLARSDSSRDAARAGQLQAIVGRLTGEAFEHTANTVKLEELDRIAQASARAYTEIADKVSQVRSQMMVEGVTSAVVSPGVVTAQPSWPEPFKFTALAFLGSGFLGLLLAFAREIVDNRLRTVDQVRRLFGKPTFGMLPMLAGGIGEKIKESPVISDPQSMFAEVARSTYTEVSALGRKGVPLSILVTSPLPGDGKSVVTLTLAAAAVAMGKRVVILDLDLRKSGVLQKMQHEQDSPELLEILRGQVAIDKLLGPPEHRAPVQLHYGDDEEVDLSKITLLSASHPVAEPAALLSSQRLQFLMQDLNARFDLTVVNAPATLAVRDARTMCEFTDHTVVVARWGTTTIDQMRATLELLGSENVAGVIFDQVDYAEHARRRYGDSIQFYFESAGYYSSPVPARLTLLGQLKRLFGRRPAYA